MFFVQKRDRAVTARNAICEIIDGYISTIQGAMTAPARAKILQMPNVVAVSSEGKNTILPRYDKLYTCVMPNLDPKMKTNKRFWFDVYDTIRKNIPTKASAYDIIRVVLKPMESSIIPDSISATISEKQDVTAFLKMSPCKYFISKAMR